jgi:MFS family permease
MEEGIKRIYLLQFVLIMSYGLLGAYLPIYLKDAGYSTFQIGEIISISAFIMLIQPLIGFLSDRFGRNVFITIGKTIRSLGIFLYTINPYLGRVMDTGGNLLYQPLYKPLIVEKSKKKHVASRLGLLMFFGVFGFTIGPAIGGFIYSISNYETIFHLLAALTFFTILLVPRKESGREKRKDLRFDINFKKPLLVLCIISLLVGYADGMRLVLFPLIFTDHYNLTPSDAGFYITLGSIGYALSILLLHKKLDRWRQKRAASTFIFLSGFFQVLMFYTNDFATFLSFSFLSSAAFALFLPLTDKLIADASRKKYLAFDMAFASAIYSLGSVFGGLTAGNFELLFGVKGVLVATAITSVIASLILFR